MSAQVNVLYLGMHVLILSDLEYVSRFWCGFEAWCAMQNTSKKGIEPTTDTDRFTIKVVQSYNVNSADVTGTDDHKDEAKQKDTLIATWQNQTPENAIKKLTRKDIKVTNLADVSMSGSHDRPSCRPACRPLLLLMTAGCVMPSRWQKDMQIRKIKNLHKDVSEIVTKGAQVVRV